MEREEQVIQLRPSIICNKREEQSALEAFQNEVLRPILKFQNNILHQLFQQQLVKFKANWAEMNAVEKKSFFDKQFNGDPFHKHIYIGTVIGLFTIKEFKFYTNHQKEVHKRIISMLKKRLNSKQI